MPKTSTVSTSSVINSTPMQKNNIKFNPVEFIKNNLNKIKWVLLGLIVIYLIYSFMNKETVSNKVDKKLEDYKIVLDKDGNPVLLGMDDIEKIKDKMNEHMINQQMLQRQQQVQQQMPSHEVPQQQVQQQMPSHEVPQQQVQQQMPSHEVPQQQVQQQMPRHEVPQQQVQQQMPRHEVPLQQQVQQQMPRHEVPPQPEQKNTVETLNNILLEESDEDQYMEDFNVKSHDLTEDEINRINHQLDELI
jgi:HAMP domain-containing protein